jgi:hypothetical protein
LPLEDGYSSFLIFLIRGNWSNRLPYASQQTQSLLNTARGKIEGRKKEREWEREKR